MSEFDARRLKELEGERREILAIVRRDRQLLAEFEAGSCRSFSRGKIMAMRKGIVDAERHSLPALTKQIMMFKRRIAAGR